MKRQQYEKKILFGKTFVSKNFNPEEYEDTLSVFSKKKFRNLNKENQKIDLLTD